MATNPKIDTSDPAQVERARALVVQILLEAHATEQALVTNLRAHIAMTPRGSYRDSLERHLTETQQHERAVARRIREIGRGRGVLRAAYGVLTTAVGQALVLTKGPLDLLRGGPDGDEKLLKNARDEVVTEALAKALGDDATARLAARHRGQEERMLEQLRGHLPKLANAVVQARATGDATYDWETTGAADAARKTVRSAQRKATTTRRPRAARAETPLAGYDKLSASDAVSKLTDLTQDQLARVVAYERANRKRATVIERAQSLQENEPFPGYDDLTARDVAQRVRDADEATAQRVRDYEGRHQRRVEVLEAASRQLSNSGSSS